MAPSEILLVTVLFLNVLFSLNLHSASIKNRRVLKAALTIKTSSPVDVNSLFTDTAAMSALYCCLNALTLLYTLTVII